MLILNPNPCIDITMWVKQLVQGSVHRAIKNETTAGGKGINVARACKTMGLDPHLYLMLPTHEGNFYRDLLDSERHDVEYLEVAGEVRKAIIMNEEASSAITVFNGLGPDITEKNWDEYCLAAAKKTQKGEIVLMMGSLPSNHPDNAIDRLAKTIDAVGGKLLVDTSPAAFKSRKTEILDFISSISVMGLTRARLSKSAMTSCWLAAARAEVARSNESRGRMNERSFRSLKTKAKR